MKYDSLLIVDTYAIKFYFCNYTKKIIHFKIFFSLFYEYFFSRSFDLSSFNYYVIIQTISAGSNGENSFLLEGQTNRSKLLPSPSPLQPFTFYIRKCEIFLRQVIFIFLFGCCMTIFWNEATKIYV